MLTLTLNKVTLKPAPPGLCWQVKILRGSGSGNGSGIFSGNELYRELNNIAESYIPMAQT